MTNTVKFWDGEGLPPVGCWAGYDTASHGLQVDQVSGYSVKECVTVEHGHHRIFINFDRGYCRLLHDVKSVRQLSNHR